ncbi:MAG TPA: winged helix DNA-binding domain-containing protein [Candidatus Limnocylindria bacterium]
MAPAAPLTTRDLNRATLARQGLLEPIRGSAADAVRRVGSLQAQHPEWPPVALAARAGSARTADLLRALTDRHVVRSSLMRLTIHVVHAEDLRPMFTVVQPLRLNQWRLLLKSDPIDSTLGKRMMAAHAVAMAALREGPRSSLELDRIMAAEVGPAATATTRRAWRQPETQVVVRAAWRHFAAFVPLVHVPWEGEGYGRSQYLLADDWLGSDGAAPDEAAARVHLARRYLAAFGPASVEDLVAYVGRGKGGIGIWRDAVATLGDEVIQLSGGDGRALFDLADAPRPGADANASPRLLARWDSLLLSHATMHRQRIIADEHRGAVFSKNADVLPTFLIDGFVAGTWDLSRANGRVEIRLHPFGRLPRGSREPLLAEAERVLALLAPGGAKRSVRIGV